MIKLKDKYIKKDTSSRLYQLPVPVIGLTGGIATGKSTVGRYLASKGLSVINADVLVKDIYSKKDTQDFIEKNFPGTVTDDVVNFKALREVFFNNTSAKTLIENFIYQRLPETFYDSYQKMNGPAFLIYDVPLLYEKKMENLFDLTVLVYAPQNIQKARLMERDGHEELMAETILTHQIHIDDKRTKADFIIDNSGTEFELATEIEQFLRQVTL